MTSHDLTADDLSSLDAAFEAYLADIADGITSEPEVIELVTGELLILGDEDDIDVDAFYAAA